jgi:hypothetical protein
VKHAALVGDLQTQEKETWMEAAGCISYGGTEKVD